MSDKRWTIYVCPDCGLEKPYCSCPEYDNEHRVPVVVMPVAPVYPYDEGDTTVIGPECFAARDGSVLNWRGENYVPQPVAPVIPITTLREFIRARYRMHARANHSPPSDLQLLAALLDAHEGTTDAGGLTDRQWAASVCCGGDPRDCDRYSVCPMLKFQKDAHEGTTE